MIALLDDVLRLFGATMLQLGDVEQPFDARDDLDERAERGRALHDALIHLADFWLLHETGDDVAGTLCRFTYTRNRDHTRVLHVDLGAGLLLDAADRLALGTDEVADLVGTDLNRDDAGRILGELRARLGHRLLHNIENVHPRLARLVQSLADDFPVQPLDLDVHLNRRHAIPGPGDLEVHVASVINPIATPAHADLIGTPASMSASEPEQTEAIDDEPLDSRISDTIRIV